MVAGGGVQNLNSEQLMRYSKLLKTLKETVNYKREVLIILHEYITPKWKRKN